MIRNPLVIINGRVQELPVGDSVPSATAEELQMYSKRIDFISDNELYKGEAAVGTPEASALWRISKVVIGIDGDVSETWASGTANFNKVWADRVTYLYS